MKERIAKEYKQLNARMSERIMNMGKAIGEIQVPLMAALEAKDFIEQNYPGILVHVSADCTWGSPQVGLTIQGLDAYRPFAKSIFPELAKLGIRITRGRKKNNPAVRFSSEYNQVTADCTGTTITFCMKAEAKPMCRQVQVGTEIKEIPIFKQLCGDELVAYDLAKANETLVADEVKAIAVPLTEEEELDKVLDEGLAAIEQLKDAEENPEPPVDMPF